MEKRVDARGLACPQPVLLAREALAGGGEVVVLVDNDTAAENQRRLGAKRGCVVTVERGRGADWQVRLIPTGAAPAGEPDAAVACGSDPGELVIVLASDRMGRGDDQLGDVLMRSFVHTLLSLDPRPRRIILYNTGARLALCDSPVIDDLRQLEAAGAELMVCGTCANFFGIKDRLGAGAITNMYDIAAALAAAGRVVSP